MLCGFLFGAGLIQGAMYVGISGSTGGSQQTSMKCEDDFVLTI